MLTSIRHSGAIVLAAATALSLHASAANTWAVIPISGRPVPELTEFDDLMVDFMDTNDIEAGVLGVMKNGKVVYLRGFGYKYDGDIALPENSLFRLASCSKPITIAGVRQRIAAGDFTLNSHPYDLGQAGGGVLDATSGGEYDPFPDEGDDRLEDITIQDLIAHQGGWDRDVTPDPTYAELEIAGDMDIASPPGRVNTVRWILGRSLDFAPGEETHYSNVGCLTMGLIVEQESGQSLVSYVRGNVLTKYMWVPRTELIAGRTFREFQDPREPKYDSDTLALSVFPTPVWAEWPYLVLNPYGGWDHEARIGQGGYVCSASTMLEFLQRYHCGIFYETLIGKPIDAVNPLTSDAYHNGSLDGVATYMCQRTDGVNVFIAFNKKAGSGHYATDFYDEDLDPALDAGGFTWPDRTSDGFWVATSSGGAGGVGGYDDPFDGVGAALAYVKDGSKLRLKAGTSSWTGTISTKLLIDAPLGNARIGQ